MEYHDFQPTGFIRDKLPDDIFLELKELCNMSSIPVNHRLAGNIEKEYHLPVLTEKVGEKLLKHIFLMANEYEKRYPSPVIKVLDKDLPMGFGEVWVNYQKKYEFNPVHLHTGVWSFVIWVQIPYNLEDELKNLSSLNSNSNIPSVFQFLYENIYGSATEELYINKSHEGTIILFPANLKHCVYPFYGDESMERISVSGNLGPQL